MKLCELSSFISRRVEFYQNVANAGRGSRQSGSKWDALASIEADLRRLRCPDINLAPIFVTERQVQIRYGDLAVTQILNLARDQELARAFRLLRKRHMKFGDRQTAKVHRQSHAGINGSRRRRDRDDPRP